MRAWGSRGTETAARARAPGAAAPSRQTSAERSTQRSRGRTVGACSIPIRGTDREGAAPRSSRGIDGVFVRSLPPSRVAWAGHRRPRCRCLSYSFECRGRGSDGAREGDGSIADTALPGLRSERRDTPSGARVTPAGRRRSKGVADRGRLRSRHGLALRRRSPDSESARNGFEVRCGSSEPMSTPAIRKRRNSTSTVARSFQWN